MKEQILSHLPANHPWRESITWFDTIGSTNTSAKQLAAAGAPQGTVLIADSQTGGRGRMGRTFQSPPGAGIYMSVILRPVCRPTELMHLTCAAAVAACDAVEKTVGFRPGIKWINDLVVDGRKLAGILTELSIAPATGLVDYAVVGIGLNCNQQQWDFDPEIRDIACSAAMVSGSTADRCQIAAALIVELKKMSDALLSEKAQIMERYRAGCVTLGTHISVIQGSRIRRGKALDIDRDGALLVDFGNGHTETVNSGEVSIRGSNGYA